jgi:VWFA-related protein
LRITTLDQASGVKYLPSSRRTRLLFLGCLAGSFFLLPSLWAQTSPSQPASTQTQPSQSSEDSIPDAPTVQPNTTPEPPPIPKPEEKKKDPNADRNPWTNQPNQPAQPAAQPNSNQFPEDENSPAPSMPPVKTVPPGTAAKQPPASQEQLYTLRVNPTLVEVPVSVRYSDGRAVYGLSSNDFTLLDNGVKQKLTFFSGDPFALSVAVVLDLGMSDAAVQKVNDSFPALVAAFAPYDEVAIYTYSSTVSEVSDFGEVTPKLTALLNQMKSERGRNTGAPVMGGPLGSSGPVVNGIPMGSPTAPVYTPPKEAHVLNDAILRAALDLSKRGRERRKIIFVISDGRESGSTASYKDVLKLLLSREIEVKAIALEGAALPVYRKLEQFHIPDQGRDNLLPKYTSATGGGTPYSELTRNALEDAYAQAMGDARNQYTLVYSPAKPQVPTKAAYHDIEVLVNRPGLKIYAKQGYYPALAR